MAAAVHMVVEEPPEGEEHTVPEPAAAACPERAVDMADWEWVAASRVTPPSLLTAVMPQVSSQMASLRTNLSL